MIKIIKKNKSETLNIALNGFYHPEPFIDGKLGNISRWTETSARIIFLNKIYEEFDCKIHLLNLNKNNKNVIIRGENYINKFELVSGDNFITFKHKGEYIDIVPQVTLCPKIDTGIEDERILGIVIYNLFLDNYVINVTNKIYYENLKPIKLNDSFVFKQKELFGKKIGIIGYVSPPSVLNSNLQFFRNMQEFQSFSDIILFSDAKWKNTIEVEDPLTVVEKNNHKIGLWTFFKCLTIAKKYNLDYFLMIESDCRVTKNNWDKELFEYAIKNDCYAYGSLNVSNFDKNNPIFKYISDLNLKSNYPCIFQGNMEGDGLTRLWTNGALTVYKTEIYYNLLQNDISKIFKEWHAWDYNSCKIIIDRFGQTESTKRIVHSDKIVSNVESVVNLNYIINNYRKFSAVHPVKTNWRPPKNQNYTFYHGGDLGDIIYSLPSIKLIGGGHINFGNKDNHDIILRTREPFNNQKYKFIEPLIKSQNYIISTNYSDDSSIEYDYNFNEFRHYWNDEQYRSSKKIDRLIDVNLDFVGVSSLFNEKEPWLNCQNKKIAKYVVSRSFRYRDISFPWIDIYQLIKNNCVFIGLSDEYEDFCKTVGIIPYFKVSDALEMAEVINGCEIFIGNQSFPCSIAIGLNKTVVQEYSKNHKDCIFDKRSNFYTKETLNYNIFKNENIT